MKPLNRHLLTLFSLLYICVSASSAMALPDDRDQPINVSADRAVKNAKKGITIYEGNVLITQGSIRVSGDKISIYDDNGTVNKMIAEGQPAKFKQKPDINSGDMVANGRSIEYDVNQETLLLKGDALLKQDGRTTNSNKINYDMKTEIVNAGDNTGRVIMVLEPKSNKQK